MAACVELGRDPIYDPSKNEGFHYGAPLADIMKDCDAHDWQTGLLLDYVNANNAHRPTKYLICTTDDADLSIVACTQGWLDKCGYEAGDILHRNCRFLQGPLTCFETIMRIRTALETATSLAVRLVNYTKHGHPFLNEFLMCPLVSKRGGVAYYISVHDPPEDLLLKVRTVTPPRSTSPPE